MILIDLFSGIGGFHEGLEMAGFKFDRVYFSDIEKYPCQIYQQRFPKSIPLGDVTKIDAEKLKQEIGSEPCIITGGFPCQDLSTAGKRRGLENEQGERTRSGLFWEIIRLADKIRPKIIILENVAGLLSHNNGRTMGIILGAISEIGYDCEWSIISAASQGAWHERKRIWFIAYSKNN